VLVVEGGPGKDQPLDEVVAKWKGISAGDGHSWSFDGPQRATQCAHAIRARLRPAAVRIGVHAGEVVRDGRHLRGEGMETARAIARAAAPGEIWVSQVVRDLVHGSALTFSPRRAVALPDGRSLTALASEAPGNQELVRTRKGR